MVKIGDLVRIKDQPYSFVVTDIFWDFNKWTAILCNTENEKEFLSWPADDLININDISLKEAFQRIRRELKENPQYLLAWKEKVNNLLYSNTSTMDIINSIFGLEDNKDKDLDDYHF